MKCARLYLGLPGGCILVLAVLAVFVVLRRGRADADELTAQERQLAVRLHPEVALYLLEEEPKLLQSLGKTTGLDLELRDDPMMHLDEFRLMSRPAGRDVTELYAVA